MRFKSSHDVHWQLNSRPTPFFALIYIITGPHVVVVLSPICVLVSSQGTLGLAHFSAGIIFAWALSTETGVQVAFPPCINSSVWFWSSPGCAHTHTSAGLQPVKPALTVSFTNAPAWTRQHRGAPTLHVGHRYSSGLTPPITARCVGCFRDCLPSRWKLAGLKNALAELSQIKDRAGSSFGQFVFPQCSSSLWPERCLYGSEQEVGERMQTLQLNEKISVGRKCPGGSPLKTGSMPEWVPGRPAVLRRRCHLHGFGKQHFLSAKHACYELNCTTRCSESSLEDQDLHANLKEGYGQKHMFELGSRPSAALSNPPHNSCSPRVSC